jgi:hypothetical protein
MASAPKTPLDSTMASATSWLEVPMDVLGVFRGQGPRNYEVWMRLEELVRSSADDDTRR